MIRSRIGNALLITLGVGLIAYASIAWSLEVLRQGQFAVGDASLIASTLVFLALGSWCVGGAISNLRAQRLGNYASPIPRMILLNLILIPLTGIVAYVLFVTVGWTVATWVVYELFLMSFTVCPLVVVLVSRRSRRSASD